MKYYLLLIGIIVTGCTTGKPDKFVINGVTRVYTPKKVLGITYATKVEEVKTKEQKLDDLDVEKKENKIKSLERQKKAAFWIGMILLCAAPACVVIGYLTSGWKFWGSMAALSASLGCAFWGFESLLPYLKWGAGVLVGCMVLWTMWKFKDFSIVEKLKNSEPGKLL